ncbi:MAG: hypothetical protein IPM29_07730 [Planctomycetes bacterium]|nr:hypothetical protein [Planctomycetota bacterium]
MKHLALLIAVSLPCAVLAQDAQRPPATVATHYFYWYRHPDEHFPGPGREGLRHGFVEPERVSYLDPDWHRGEFRDMAAAGIDVALPVYWGCEGSERRANLYFADAGLPAMVEALDRMAAAGEPAPKLGLFYDTSTLLNGVRGVEPRDQRADLTTTAGRALFDGTVLRFFDAIPARHRAAHRGRPLVVLYVSGFAERWDASLCDGLREAFVERFGGAPPFVVADASWGEIGQDATTSWGAALVGPTLFEGVAQIGPGYDDSPVPGRHTPIRDREDGAFYLFGWRAAIEHRPELVLLETWNELHEGTEICRSRDLGDSYLRWTRDAVARLRSGEPGPAIVLRNARPLPRRDLSWGADARGAERLHWSPQDACGLRPIGWADGPIDVHRDALVATCPPERPVTYVYLQVSDHWAFDRPADAAELLLTLRGSGLRGLRLEYDSHDAAATLDGAYTPAPSAELRAADESGLDECAAFRLPRARLADRQNGGADLRVCVFRGGVSIGSIELTVAP